MNTTRRKPSNSWPKPDIPTAARLTSTPTATARFAEAIMGYLNAAGIKTKLNWMKYTAIPGPVFVPQPP